MKKKDLTKEETKCYKMTEREIFKKFDNLNEDELNTKSNKNIFLEKISWQVLLNAVEAKRKEE